MGIFTKLSKLFKGKNEPEPQNVVQAEQSNGVGVVSVLSTQKIVTPTPDVEVQVKQQVARGSVLVNKVELTVTNFDSLQHRFIAFDTETTGLSPYNDRIVELGAVVFEDGNSTKSFGSLVNSGIEMPPSATRVNHITNDMLSTAPAEEEVFSQFVSFLGDALDGSTLLCAHNASFDLNFIKNTLERLGYSGTLNAVDTLKLSRELLHLPNFKQDTVASYFCLQNKNSHRASSDAEICGEIMCRLLELKKADIEIAKKKLEKCKLSDEEMEICAVIQDILKQNNCWTALLRYYKSSSGYISVTIGHVLFKFKLGKKGKYIIVSPEYSHVCGLRIEPCTQSESCNGYVRIYFDKGSELEQLTSFMVHEYNHAKELDEECERYDMDPYDWLPEGVISIADDNLPKFIEREAQRHIQYPIAAPVSEWPQQSVIAPPQKSKAEEHIGPKKTTKRRIMQKTDGGTIIEEFPSVAEAVRKTGINAKSIRCAATGVQKHAGGFCWSYCDDTDE